MGWGGIIAGALGGGAQAVGQIADSQIDTNKRKDLAQHQAEIDIAKQEAIARTSESIRREGVIYDSTGEGGDARRKADVLRTKEVGAAETGVAVDRTTQVGTAQTGVELDREGKLAPAKVKTAGLIASEQDRVRREGVIASGSDPAYLKAERAIAMTRHFDSGAGLRKVQEEAARLDLEGKKVAKALIDKYTAEKDPIKKAELIQEMTVRGLIKSGEFDTEKVTEEKTNPDGTVVKTERTQKRKPGTTDLTDPKGGSEVRYDAQGNAYVKGPDGKPMLQSAAGKPAAAAPSVPGREYYNTPTPELKRMATKPRGVSTAEANAAQAELDARQGEARLSGR